MLPQLPNKASQRYSPLVCSTMSRLSKPVLSAPFSCPAMLRVGRAMRNPVSGPSAIAILMRPDPTSPFGLAAQHLFELLGPDDLCRLRRRARRWLGGLVVGLDVDLELMNDHGHRLGSFSHSQYRYSPSPTAGEGQDWAGPIYRRVPTPGTFISINCPGCSTRGFSMPLASAMRCQLSPLPWLSAMPCSVVLAGAWANGRDPAAGVGPACGEPDVERKINLVIFCCDRFSVMLARSGLPSLEKNSSDSSSDSMRPSN